MTKARHSPSWKTAGADRGAGIFENSGQILLKEFPPGRPGGRPDAFGSKVIHRLPPVAAFWQRSGIQTGSGYDAMAKALRHSAYMPTTCQNMGLGHNAAALAVFLRPSCTRSFARAVHTLPRRHVIFDMSSREGHETASGRELQSAIAKNSNCDGAHDLRHRAGINGFKASCLKPADPAYPMLYR